MPLKISLEKFQETIQQDPIYFFDSVLGCSHWSAQDEILRSVFKNQRTTVKSCHGTGKSYSAARIAHAFLFAYKNSIVVTTAPTFRQVENILWREMRQAASQSKMKLGGNMLKTKFEIDDKWYAIGISSDKDDNFQGFHAEHLLVIADEAAGVPETTMQVIEALMTSAGTRQLLIGNPTNTNGTFCASHKSDLYTKISISCFDTPNFTKNGIKDLTDLLKLTRPELEAMPLVYPELVTPLWAWERAESWGIDSPMFQSRVLAEFPEEGDDTLIKLSHIERALQKEWDEEQWKFRPQRKAIGIDVARKGSDSTVGIAFDNGKMFEKMFSYVGKDTMKTVGHAVALFNDLGFSKEFDTFVVDDTGVGGGVTDRLLELGYNVLPVNNAESASDKEKFRDIKAEIFWNLRQAFLEGSISIHDISRIIQDLSSIRYDYMSSGKLFIVSKKDMKRDGLPSPDFADALALAYYGTQMIDGGDAVIETKKTKKEEGDDENSTGTIVGDIFGKRGKF